MLIERQINIDKDNLITGGFTDVMLTDDGLKLPAGVHVYAYTVVCEKMKPFNAAITACNDGDVLKLPAHNKKALTVNVICWR